MCLVAWPLNENEAGGDLVLIETSKQCHLQPHFHSKARQISKQLYNGLFPAEKHVARKTGDTACYIECQVVSCVTHKTRKKQELDMT